MNWHSNICLYCFKVNTNIFNYWADFVRSIKLFSSFNFKTKCLLVIKLEIVLIHVTTLKLKEMVKWKAYKHLTLHSLMKIVVYKITLVKMIWCAYFARNKPLFLCNIVHFRFLYPAIFNGIINLSTNVSLILDFLIVVSKFKIWHVARRIDRYDLVSYFTLTSLN